jgi:hypothetical protein
VTARAKFLTGFAAALLALYVLAVLVVWMARG